MYACSRQHDCSSSLIAAFSLRHEADSKASGGVQGGYRRWNYSTWNGEGGIGSGKDQGVMGRYCRKPIITLFWTRSIVLNKCDIATLPRKQSVREHTHLILFALHPLQGCRCPRSGYLICHSTYMHVAYLETSFFFVSPVKRKKACGGTGSHVFLRPGLRHMQPGAGCCCKHPFANHHMERLFFSSRWRG